ncbi:MAG: transglycosylase domain-containing protein [Acidobacteriota bacterium]|jgi:membrane peptidoglycan carboxypeptidase|nr:transglycosylase domain-containing protein [Acidobacteriota bacterium]
MVHTMFENDAPPPASPDATAASDAPAQGGMDGAGAGVFGLGRLSCRLMRLYRRLRTRLCVVLVVAAAGLHELQTSVFSSRILAHYARKMSFQVEPGPSPNIVFPKDGPFDIRAGYALLPEFQRRLEAAGYRVTHQARLSPEMERIARWGLHPPYDEPASTRLSIKDGGGREMFAPPPGGACFGRFEDIPPLVVKALLLIENRRLGQPADAHTNPVVDWPRLAKAALSYAGHRLGLSTPVEGGSTLATQMEKYRHHGEGRTDSALAKLRQMVEASLKVYRKGTDTRRERRRIVLDYLNTIPLAAAPGYGEVYGLGDGLGAWFALDLRDASAILAHPADTPEKARAFKKVAALLCAVKAPSHYLLQDRKALEARTDFHVRLMEGARAISPELARLALEAPLDFAPRPPEPAHTPYAEGKATNQVRARLAAVLGVPGFYELDRLHLDVHSTIDLGFQQRVVELFGKLRDPGFVASSGLAGRRLLADGDPAKVVYGLILFERTPQGNLLRAATDTLEAPFDVNTGMKMQLGSTAKLRTLVHYLDIVAGLHAQFASLGVGELRAERARAEAGETPHDPLTRWVLEALDAKAPAQRPGLDATLQMALDRRYPADAGETFFTGGGVHTFHNFQGAGGAPSPSVRDATRDSVNLVYVRLMRDIVRHYAARLPYDAEAALKDPGHPVRRRLLVEGADAEARAVLRRAYDDHLRHRPEDAVALLLGEKAGSARHRAIAFYAWNRGAGVEALGEALRALPEPPPPEEVGMLAKAYGNPRLTLLDYGRLLGAHPLKVWCAGQMSRPERPSWDELWARSGRARALASDWLFHPRNRRAQDRRLRIRIEQDAFAGVTEAWRRLGFPFERLSPTLATALGSSGDRPEALARLVGILLNGGVRKPDLRTTRLHFAAGTPYETVMAPAPSGGEQVLSPAVAKAVLPVMASVVEGGTAIRLDKAITDGRRPLPVGGKTGSGDNRRNAVGRGGRVISSRPVNRTATFAFYVGDRYFGVMTAFVPGADSGGFSFTSSLPVAVLKMLAPAIQDLWNGDAAQAG